ncbi:hypothetical protein ACORG1_04605 [Mycobacterium sp. TJFP1]
MLLAVAAAVLAFAIPVAAEPCGSDVLGDIEYALDIASGVALADERGDMSVPCSCGGGAMDSECQCKVFCLCKPILAENVDVFKECMSDYFWDWCGEHF